MADNAMTIWQKLLEADGFAPAPELVQVPRPTYQEQELHSQAEAGRNQSIADLNALQLYFQPVPKLLIEKQYRGLSKLYHPDKSSSSTNAEFLNVSAAKGRLLDVCKQTAKHPQPQKPEEGVAPQHAQQHQEQQPQPQPHPQPQPQPQSQPKKPKKGVAPQNAVQSALSEPCILFGEATESPGYRHLSKKEIDQNRNSAEYRLRAAARAGCCHCIARLVSSGVEDINDKSTSNWNALDNAMYAQQTTAATLLRECGGIISDCYTKYLENKEENRQSQIPSSSNTSGQSAEYAPNQRCLNEKSLDNEMFKCACGDASCIVQGPLMVPRIPLEGLAPGDRLWHPIAEEYIIRCEWCNYNGDHNGHAETYAWFKHDGCIISSTWTRVKSRARSYCCPDSGNHSEQA